MLDPWYDDSDDDDYTGGVLSDECFARKVKQRKQVSSSLAAADTTHVGQQVHAMARVKAVCSGRDRGRNKKHQSKLQGGEGTSHEGNPSIMDMTETLMINVILYLSQLEKLRLQCTCRIMGRAMDSPEAWTTLDVSLATIGWATSRGGRKRKLSPSSAYHCCKEVLKQTRFGAIVSANLAGLLLGIGGNPDLLTKLLLQCPGVTSLDLTHATADSEHCGVPFRGGVLEGALTQYAPELRKLRITMHASSTVNNDSSASGLLTLLSGCRKLESLALCAGFEDTHRRLNTLVGLTPAHTECLCELEVTEMVISPKSVWNLLQAGPQLQQLV
eukprot:TRINITY_DN831_c0_g1_i4.p1 TRINITY_DN831_c0_g1~~TRINITY_DN831_c0_g1_i4.p1  ORF type:complete len:329 (-),score=16.97 TRINITY_DN831_c0_g1_i4:647-1633(-)